jgi:phosphatidate cytidylyltransferase
MKKEFQKRLISSLIIIPIALFFVIKGSVFFTFFLGVFFLATSYEWYKMNKKTLFRYSGISYLFFSVFIAYLVRENFGLNIFIFIIITCVFTDLGGYIFGKTFKGPKLTKISPNKTYSGMIGGFFLSVIAGSLSMKHEYTFFPYTNFEIDLMTKLDETQSLSFLSLILFISAISQIGDLIISYFKRLTKIKDTGKFIPGHGGFLDRIDGIIFAIPASYFLFILII